MDKRSFTNSSWKSWSLIRRLVSVGYKPGTNPDNSQAELRCQLSPLRITPLIRTQRIQILQMVWRVTSCRSVRNKCSAPYNKGRLRVRIRQFPARTPEALWPYRLDLFEKKRRSRAGVLQTTGTLDLSLNQSDLGENVTTYLANGFQHYLKAGIVFFDLIVAYVTV